MTDTILVSVKLHSEKFEEAVLKECPRCFALVRDDRLDQHIWSHDAN